MCIYRNIKYKYKKIWCVWLIYRSLCFDECFLKIQYLFCMSSYLKMVLLYIHLLGNWQIFYDLNIKIFDGYVIVYCCLIIKKYTYNNILSKYFSTNINETIVTSYKNQLPLLVGQFVSTVGLKLKKWHVVQKQPHSIKDSCQKQWWNIDSQKIILLEATWLTLKFADFSLSLSINEQTDKLTVGQTHDRHAKTQ